ncbi:MULTISPECIES: M23 family metallopeptidase [unclassified Luteimonas]
MKYIAMALAGLLLAAAVHLALMSPTERAQVLHITRATTVPVDASGGRAVEAAPTSMQAGAGDSTLGPAGGEPRIPALPVDTGSVPPMEVSAPVLPSGLVVPVQGVAPSQLSPTFEDARSGGRVHEALDIMAPAGTPVLAVADGHIEKLFDSRQGGLTIYQFEPGGRHAYYYAHLERYAPGLAEQQHVRQGQVIGYVGSSGNADPTAPHLHFAIFVLGPEQRWWEGAAIDPWPLLSVETR